MGAINIDLTMYMHRLPLAGETIVTDNFQTFPGGKGGNQAAAAATLGAVVRYFTKLGDDAFSTQLMEEQKKVGVDTDYIIIEKGQTAGIAMIRADEGGQNSISFTPGANKLLTPQDVREHPEVFDGCDILLITMEIMPETVYEAIRMASERNMTVIVDPSPVPQGREIPADVIPLIHYAKPNETEAAIFTGKTIASMDRCQSGGRSADGTGISDTDRLYVEGRRCHKIRRRIQDYTAPEGKFGGQHCGGRYFPGSFCGIPGRWKKSGCLPAFCQRGGGHQHGTEGRSVFHSFLQ